jgi:pimeloyl-ACP methyl ester carboxylesterase
MIVFVHGVPETAAIWDGVRAAVDRPSVAVALPGFGCPVPDGFGGTKDDYVAWLLGELDGIGEPVDLVGHDWGAGLVYRIATAHGDRLRSWAADIGNLAHPDYEWHDVAKLWQTPGDGEAFVAGLGEGPLDDRAGLFVAMGVPLDDARAMAEGFDQRMGRCVLSLYRSAVPNAHAHWGPWAPTSAPGLVLHPTDDPFDDEALAAETATALGAGFAPLAGVGHFWPYQAPAAAAAVLVDFWGSLPAR